MKLYSKRTPARESKKIDTRAVAVIELPRRKSSFDHSEHHAVAQGRRARACIFGQLFDI
ncbi:MAG TPA: hypothetical protein VGV59_08795 [Pyrinomonadaceae bacterium]|nr:hypothetical protein [Pyrinomonadaceae bacterium]